MRVMLSCLWPGRCWRCCSAMCRGCGQWFEALDGVRKAQVMVGLLLLAAAGAFGASCYTPWVVVECTEAGFWQLVELFIAAVIANQVTYTLAVRPTRTAVEQA
jgi:hypothetical protein